MTKKQYILIYFISLAFFGAFSLLQKTPGYMDSAYYYSVGTQIATGKGFTEPFIWNYLSQPTNIPMPAFTYWMPLAGLLSALGMLVFHSTSFLAAKIPFILLASFIPILNIYFVNLFSSKRSLSFAAGFLGLACCYYLPYLTITETFVPYFILGGLFFILSNKLLSGPSEKKKIWVLTLFLGIVSGLMHLTRADGIIWLAGSGFVLFYATSTNKKNRIIEFLLLCALDFLGYAAVMSPWFIRNLVIYKSIFPAGSNLAVYFTNYNNLFSYSVNKINISSLFSSGISSILQNRFTAMQANFQTIIGTVGEIVLLPFIAAGLWINRKQKLIQFSLIIVLVMFLTMSLIFPFAGQRGGFFHSMSAVQCFFWGIAPIGFEFLINKLAALKKWKAERSLRLYGATILGVLIILSVIVVEGKIYGNVMQINSAWDSRYNQFIQVDAFLQQNGVVQDQLVMVNDSPGYYTMTGRNSIQMTSGTLTEAVTSMKQFGVKYLLIDNDHTSEFDQLYTSSGDLAPFKYLGKVNDFVIYQLAE